MNQAVDFVASRLSGRRRVPLVMQTEAAECGLACLAMIGNYHGHQLDMPGLRRRFSTSLKGATLARVMEVAHALGFEARGLRVPLEALGRVALPCVLHWNLNHFVVLERVNGQYAEILDPAFGHMRMPMAEVSKHFTGVVLELRRAATFRRSVAVQPVSLRMLTGQIDGVGKVLTQVFGLAFVIELLALAMPFQMQWVMDNVLVTGDGNLLLVLCLGFLAIMGMQTALLIARGWVISWLGATLNAQWINNLFGHLLRLPLDFFEKRHMGDVLSRFNSIRAIQATLTGSFIETVLDGLMGLSAIVILLCYSVPLTALVLAALVLYGGMRWLMFRQQRAFNEEQLIYRARQDSELMESVRGVRTIKLANKQSERRERLANATIETAQRELYIQRLALVFSSLNQGLFGMQRILLLSLGAWLSLRGRLSVGMIVAFLAYADQCTSRVAGVMDRLVDFKMLRLHAERIADIALSDVEANEFGHHSGPEPKPSITVRNLGFRYAEGEPWVLKDVNLTVSAGESVAIVGPSGCGKTTLAKLILGLLEPTEGHIEVGGVDIRKFGMQNYRRMLAAVMQDDQLFAGSIADNISFFDAAADMTAIQNAAVRAAIHDDVAAMPMGYESLVGDMGSSLSGGQRQRVILARALYRQPRILLLDEATSHLDVNNEQLINASVREMEITRIVIAHRPETIASADRVVRVSAGRVWDESELAAARRQTEDVHKTVL